MKPSFLFHFLQLNLALIFISTSGVLGSYIELPVPATIGMRALFAGIFLFLFVKWRKFDLRIRSKDRLTLVVSGILLGAHWITYFYALQLSNVAIGMLSLFTYPAITAILEPILSRKRILPFHILLCILVLIGIYFLVPDLDFKNDSFKAVGFGVLSALCFAVRNLIMKAKINQYQSSVLMMHQLFVIAVLLSPTFFFLGLELTLDFLPATLLLALLTTAIGHTLFVMSLKHFSATTTSIISCTQPIYGIILGIIFLNDVPAGYTWIGGGIILLTVLAESLRLSRKPK